MKCTARVFQKALLEWFAASARDLPFRRSPNPYHIYLAEIILQQTRVEQGLPYYERFVKRFPTLEALAQASEQDVLKQWEGLGYYTRARNMHRAAAVIMEQYQGRFPESPELLQLLPGIGKYTAGAIASIAFNKAVPVLDGNVKRALSRLDALDAPIDSPETERLLWKRAAALVPKKSPGEYNQALMELGARLCIPRAPFCSECPVQKQCDAYARNIQDNLPVRTPKKPRPHYAVAVAVIHKNGRYLIGKRPSQGFLGGLWEFPGGRIQAGENAADAVARECREELGVAVRVGGLLAVINHAYTHFRVTLHVYRCTIVKGKPKPNSHTDLRWVVPDDFKTYAFPKGNHKFMHLLAQEGIE
ncbi:MAG TPA: A/G-specific adenine glycosylase [Candidatus Hydrogenedentes bacterium]|nr:A/G-specific adenine glycosylase [Candidatus Hydrogenedentota bacterium]